MNFNLKTIILSVAVGTCLSACHHDTPDTVTSQSFEHCYAIVTDQNSGTTTVNSSVIISSLLNWTAMSSDVTITGMQLDGQTMPATTLIDLPCKSNAEGWGNINVIAPTPGPSQLVNTPAITDFKFKWLFRLDLMDILGQYDPACAFSFIANQRYKVVGSRQPFIVSGPTVSTGSDGKEFTAKSPIYNFDLDFATQRAKIRIAGAKFAENMRGLDMEFADIPFSIVNGGESFVLATDALTPTIMGTPMTDYPITALVAEIVPGDRITLKFNCNQPRLGTYSVNATLNWSDFE